MRPNAGPVETSGYQALKARSEKCNPKDAGKVDLVHPLADPTTRSIWVLSSDICAPQGISIENMSATKYLGPCRSSCSLTDKDSYGIVSH